jgi:thiol-disulfide isomerase/thioredoxin
MRWINRRSLFALLCVLPLIATADIRTFNQGSINAIENSKQNRAFVLMLWSLDCPPCFKELAMLQKLPPKWQNRVVLINTDGAEQTTAVDKIVEEFQLHNIQHWIFSQTMSPALRHSIDPNWRGELPRSYFYNGRERISYSGLVTRVKIDNWLRAGDSSNTQQAAKRAEK